MPQKASCCGKVTQTLPQAISALSEFWTSTLLPGLQQVWAFVQANIVPILAGLAAIILAVVIPALFAWAASAISAAAGTIAALAPVVLPLLAIGAVVGLLVKAWQSNWLGIRDTLTAVWEGTLRPALQSLWEWLKVNVPIAIQALKEFWVTVLLPAMEAVWAFITGTLIPIFVEVWTWLKDTLTQAIQILSDYWNETLLPTIRTVWEFISEYLVPLFVSIANLIGVVLKNAITILTAAWNNVLLPALRAVWRFIFATLQPVLDKLKKFWVEHLQPALEKVAEIIKVVLLKAWNNLTDAFEKARTNTLGPLQRAFEWIKGLLEDVKGLIDGIAKGLGSVKIPKALQGHSPPPLAVWFADIADAAALLTAQLPAINAGLAMSVASPTGGGVVNNYGASPSYSDVYNIDAHYAYQDERTLREEIQFLQMRQQVLRG